MNSSFETFDEFLEGASRGAPLTNSVGRAPMTRARLQSLILQGFGQGRGEIYVPWIRVTRGNAPRMSNHFVAVISAQPLPLHLLSGLEYGAARVASWLGAEEVRTQFPLFPWDGHPHPAAGLDAATDAALPRTRGLLDIAHAAGIKHGCYVAAPDLPYVATTDLLISRHGRLHFWSVKPSEVLAKASPDARVHQRIRLEALYAEAVGASHAVYDGSHASDRLLANLEWLEPPRHERTSPKGIEARLRYVDRFNARGADERLDARIEAAASDAEMAIAEGQRHFRAAAWLGQIDIDLTRPVLMSRPMTTGGAFTKRALQTELLGEQQ